MINNLGIETWYSLLQLDPCVRSLFIEGVFALQLNVEGVGDKKLPRDILSMKSKIA
jgi:hypothetical protein